MYEIFDRLLQERGLTVYRVAKDTGLNAAMFTSWKKGDYTPKQDKLSKIAAYFGVSLDYLMTGEDRTPEQVINKVFSSLEATGKPKDPFIEDIQKDPVFIQQIRLLWSLPITCFFLCLDFTAFSKRRGNFRGN